MTQTRALPEAAENRRCQVGSTFLKREKRSERDKAEAGGRTTGVSRWGSEQLAACSERRRGKRLGDDLTQPDKWAEMGRQTHALDSGL